LSEPSAETSEDRGHHGARHGVGANRGARMSAELIAPGLATTESSARLALLGLIVAAWIVIAVLFRNPFYDEIAVTGSALMLAGTIGFYRWQPGPGREAYRYLGFFAFLYTFISSGVNILQDVDPVGFTPTPAAFSFAIEASLVFAVAFMVGAAVFGGNIAPAVEPDEHDPGLSPFFLAVLAAVSTATSVIFSLFIAQVGSSIGRLGTLPLVLLNPGLVVPFVTGAKLYQGKRVLPIAIVVLGHAFLTMMSSAIGAVSVVIRDIVFTHILLRRQLPRGLLAVGFVVVMILNPAKHLVRYEMASQGDRGSMGTFDRALTLWTNAITETWFSQGRTDEETMRSYSDTPRRFDYNWVGAHIYAMVPDTLPFEDGTTYEDIPLVLIPRVFMPDKPTSAGYMRSRWTVKLGMQSWESASLTAVAIPAPFEAYWNFGWAGVIAVTGGMLQLAPRDPVARAGYVVLLASSLGIWLDMLVWLVPSFAVVGAAAVLVRVFCRLGQRSSNERPGILTRAVDAVDP
jgi:hypothetical protein